MALAAFCAEHSGQNSVPAARFRGMTVSDRGDFTNSWDAICDLRRWIGRTTRSSQDLWKKRMCEKLRSGRRQVQQIKMHRDSAIHNDRALIAWTDGLENGHKPNV